MTKPELDKVKMLAELPMSELVMHNMEDVRRLFIDVVKDLQKENERLRECAEKAKDIILDTESDMENDSEWSQSTKEAVTDWLNKYSDLMGEE